MKRNGNNTRQNILRAALKTAEKRGYSRVTMHDAAEGSGTTTALIQHYFNSAENLRREVLITAIANRNLHIIAQALGALDSLALQMPDELKQKVLNFITQRAFPSR